MTLDVKNAFNTVPWIYIDAAAASMGLLAYIRRFIRSYLFDKSILVPGGDQLNVQRMLCGVLQSSVLGMTLWNMFYDELLRLNLPDGASTIGFADDLTLLVVNHTAEGLEAATNQALAMINDWVTNKRMALAHQKTETVVLTRKWAFTQPVFRLGGHQFSLKRAIKYLGLTLDSKLTFTSHVMSDSASATASTKAIGRFFPNVGGPSMTKRLLLASMVQARLLYAVPVWAERVVKFKTDMTMMNRSLRLAAIRVSRCYRTVFMPAALLLASLPPANLLALERLSLRRSRTSVQPSSSVIEIKNATLQSWQDRWAAETQVASWMRRLLSSVTRWVN